MVQDDELVLVPAALLQVLQRDLPVLELAAEVLWILRRIVVLRHEVPRKVPPRHEIVDAAVPLRPRVFRDLALRGPSPAFGPVVVLRNRLRVPVGPLPAEPLLHVREDKQPLVLLHQLPHRRPSLGDAAPTSPLTDLAVPHPVLLTLRLVLRGLRLRGPPAVAGARGLLALAGLRALHLWVL